MERRTIAILIALAFLAATLILGASLPSASAPAPAVLPAFGSAVNTDAIIVNPSATTPFTEPGALQNITFTAPDTLTIGPSSGGTYQVSYNVNLRNTTLAPVTNTFAVEVNGTIAAGTEASVTIPAAGTVTLNNTASIQIPAGATVRLVNTGTVDAELNNASGVSATLNLQQTGTTP